MMYAYARLDRTGLGNMLFPWARSEVFRRDKQCPALWPTWTQWARIGPWLRREKDKRLYRHVFSSSGYISGMRRAALLTTQRRIPEASITGGGFRDEDGGVVEFRGMEGHFDSFAKENVFIRQRLEGMTHQWVRQTVSTEWPEGRNFIAVHIRRGDFQPWDPEKASSRFMSMQLPVDWYLSAILKAKTLVGHDVETLVFTDGDGRGLESLLSRPHTQLASDSAAVCHLLGMANARAIVGSASSFSMWAAFLSDAPAIWFPGVPTPPRRSPELNVRHEFGIPIPGRPL